MWTKLKESRDNYNSRSKDKYPAKCTFRPSTFLSDWQNVLHKVMRILQIMVSPANLGNLSFQNVILTVEPSWVIIVPGRVYHIRSMMSHTQMIAIWSPTCTQMLYFYRNEVNLDHITYSYNGLIEGATGSLAKLIEIFKYLPETYFSTCTPIL